MKIGIIGGSGFYDIDGFELKEWTRVDTPYGSPSDEYCRYSYGGHDIFFLPRHGRDHKIAPHLINYRANIEGYHILGVEKIFTISSAGGISVSAGELVVPKNGIDNTGGRQSTFFDDGTVHHIDLASPYCPASRTAILTAADKAGVTVRDGGVTICTNGPRLETAAEINAYAKWGADLVGMTLFPECALARERGICYANISVITNLAAGCSGHRLTVEEMTQTMSRRAGDIKKILRALFSSGLDSPCECRATLNESKINK